MPTIRTLGCYRCELLDGDAHGRTCCHCRRLDAEADRRRIQANLASSRWHTPMGEIIAAGLRPNEARIERTGGQV